LLVRNKQHGMRAYTMQADYALNIRAV